MGDFESFTMIETDVDALLDAHLDGTYSKLNSAPRADLDIPFTDALRQKFPKHILVTVPVSNVNLLVFAALGHARAELNTDDDSVFRWRGYVQAPRGGDGMLGDAIFFGRYRFAWSGEEFIIYIMNNVQYILYPCGPSETPLSNSTSVDALLLAAGKALGGEIDQFIYVYDGYWSRSRNLWEQVQKTNWDNVILDPKEKEALQEVAGTFFDSKEVYEQFGIPWKRGLIFYGPVGNGKTISTKALMHTLYDRKSPKSAVPTLYVKSAPQTYNIREVFQLARAMAPCLLVMEDIETIVTNENRSYFFNEVDGLESNDGILMIASTNYMERLDPGLAKRPSRFDRKYLFPLPGKDQRIQYAEFWRKKLLAKSSIKFPPKLCPAIAGITEGFSFAYMQEAFVASLLVIAHDQTNDLAGLRKDQAKKSQDVSEEYVVNWIEDRVASPPKDKPSKKDDLNNYRLWRVMQKQVEILRHDMESKDSVNETTYPETSQSEGSQRPRDYNRMPAPPRGVHNERATTNTIVPQNVGYFNARSTGSMSQPSAHNFSRLLSNKTLADGASSSATPFPPTNEFHSSPFRAQQHGISGMPRYYARNLSQIPTVQQSRDMPIRVSPNASPASQEKGKVPEASPTEVMEAGVFKFKEFTETAFESVPW